MWLYIIYPIEKYEYIANTAPAKKVLALKARTLEPYGVHTHRTYGLPWKYESGTVEKGKTVRWTQTTQLSRPMAGPVLPYLPTALQLNRTPMAGWPALPSGWRRVGSRGLLELARPTVRAPITITAPLPCTYAPNLQSKPYT